MKIEIFYFEGCPNHKTAVKRVQEVLCDQGMSAELVEVNVPHASIADELGFLGSPSIRVNGVDVEPGARSARDYGMMCRMYAVNGRREGLPSRRASPLIYLVMRQCVRNGDEVRQAPGLP